MSESLLEKILREKKEKEASGLAAYLSALSNSSTVQNASSLNSIYSSLLKKAEKRKVFISYHHGNDEEVKDFLDQWAEKEKVFIPKGLGITDEDDFIDSDNPEYVMGQIRKKYLGDSTVTIVLIGSCTHSRRYVDWEIKTSLRKGESYTPNGLIGILLQLQMTGAHLPPRFHENWNKEHKDCYARYYFMPTTAEQLRNWIEDAYNAITTRNKLIKNDQDMMKYNSECKVCKITH
ncbi:MAG: TIR domain-containing protein [Elusimicrobia bacterium]|nr:TIR domain-containing protein [Elusimicrobiota bacterium]